MDVDHRRRTPRDRSRCRARRRRACDLVLRQAEERLDQLPLLTSVVVGYGIAYDACHDIGEALLAAYGVRTTNGPGQHEALGRYFRTVFDKPPEGSRRDPAVAHSPQVRR